MELRSVPRERSDPWRLLAIGVLKQAAHDGDADFMMSQWAQGVAGLAELTESETMALAKQSQETRRAAPVSADATRVHRIVVALNRLRDEVETTPKGSVTVTWAGSQLSLKVERVLEA